MIIEKKYCDICGNEANEIRNIPLPRICIEYNEDDVKIPKVLTLNTDVCPHCMELIAMQIKSISLANGINQTAIIEDDGTVTTIGLSWKGAENVGKNPNLK